MDICINRDETHLNILESLIKRFSKVLESIYLIYQSMLNLFLNFHCYFLSSLFYGFRNFATEFCLQRFLVIQF